jgi:hypothetical protein
MKNQTLFVERYALGDGIEGTPRPPDEALAAISESNTEILSRYPARDMRQAVEAKLAARERVLPFNAEQAPRRVAPRVARLAYSAAAACALALVAFLAVRTTMARDAAGTLANGLPRGDGAIALADGERAKGAGPRLFVYRQSDSGAERLDPETRVKPDDVLQVSYFAGGDRFGAILSVDGNGTVTQHYPDSGDTMAPLSIGGEISLDFSYKLDDAPKFERFFLVAGRKPISLRGFKDALADAAAADQAGTFPPPDVLPKGVHVIDLLLHK